MSSPAKYVNFVGSPLCFVACFLLFLVSVLLASSFLSQVISCPDGTFTGRDFFLVIFRFRGINLSLSLSHALFSFLILKDTQLGFFLPIMSSIYGI